MASNKSADFHNEPLHTISPDLEAHLREEARRQIEEAEADAIQRPGRFLAAWKRGVEIAGTHYFRIEAESVAAAADKNQLRPNMRAIRSALGVISRGEGAFLAAMYSFFNADDGQKLLIEAGFPNICDLAAKLDKERAEVIAELFLSYAGW
jgi:hypothetical protein